MFESTTEGTSQRFNWRGLSVTILTHIGKLTKKSASWFVGIFKGTSGRTTRGLSGVSGTNLIVSALLPTTHRPQSKPSGSDPLIGSKTFVSGTLSVSSIRSTAMPSSSSACLSQRRYGPICPCIHWSDTIFWDFQTSIPKTPWYCTYPLANIYHIFCWVR